jgi:outer membrane lipoprotein carrier protein
MIVDLATRGLSRLRENWFLPRPASFLGTLAFAANRPSIPWPVRDRMIHLLTSRSLLRRVIPRPARAKRRTFSSVVLLSLIATCSSLHAAEIPQQLPPVHELAQKVDAYYNRLRSLRADFTESYQGMGVRRQESGSLLLRKPGKMRWNYSQPQGKIFILDGKYGWFYSPGDAQAERLAASHLDDMRSPLRFLLGHTQLEKEFQSLSLSSDANGLKLSGVPKGMQERVSDVTLGVEPDGVIRSITITETDGARTAFTFTHNEPNAPAPESEFVFRPPEGVSVIDGLPPV